MFPTRMRLAAMRRLPETGWDLRIASPSRPQLPEDLEYRVADVSQTLEAQEVEWPGDSDIPIRFRRAGATLRIPQNVPRVATGH